MIEKALRENDNVLIAIGSTIESFQPENPFTIGERIQMIDAALAEAKISPTKFRIIPVPNINNYALWPKYVELSVPPFQTIYTGSKIVRELFETHNRTLKHPYKIIFIKKELEISATKVRALIVKSAKLQENSNTSRGSKNWEKLVPKSVAALLNEWKSTERLLNIDLRTNEELK